MYNAILLQLMIQSDYRVRSSAAVRGRYRNSDRRLVVPESPMDDILKLGAIKLITLPVFLIFYCAE